MTRVDVRRFLIGVAVALALAGATDRAAAQSTGMVKGKVTDAEGKPVQGAKISIDFEEGMKRHHETTTNNKGEFIQIGLMPGNYKVTASKEKLGAQAQTVRVRLGEPTELNFKLVPGQGEPTKEDIAKAEALKKTFADGVTASRAGNHDEAIQKFEAAAAMIPSCFDCYYNMGYSYSQKKDFDKAAEAYQKAIEMKPDYADAYNALANVYNAQRKFDEAAAASAKAAELAGTAGAAGGAGGGADAFYNQGVILWNAGKIAEAKKQFEEAVKANPNHAEAQYQLGLALLNEGKMEEAVGAFEKYLVIAPEGPNAAQAKALVAQLKK
jgi:tetratricopeptide (TPR) repeat protein